MEIVRAEHAVGHHDCDNLPPREAARVARHQPCTANKWTTEPSALWRPGSSVAGSVTVCFKMACGARHECHARMVGKETPASNRSRTDLRSMGHRQNIRRDR